jgi:methyltransferase (TIGR00027 family)
MRDQDPSGTAIGVAQLRAAHQVLDDDPKVLLDPIAVGLVPGSTADEIRVNAERFQSPIRRAIRAILVMRSRYVEDALAQAVKDGVTQYVILGAGMDTFAYRQPVWARSLAVFEIDHPSTQGWKRARLEDREVSIPLNLRFCPVDFETTSLSEALEIASFDFAAKSFFSWLGVTQYLTGDAIVATLAFVAGLPHRTRIAFTFILPDEHIAEGDKRLKEHGRTLAASQGEPWLTEFAPADLKNRLVALGFSRLVHFDDEAANAQYFDARRDRLRAPTYEHVMVAEV